jgi:hypothetical protein
MSASKEGPQFAHVSLVAPCIRIQDNATIIDCLNPKLVRVSDNRVIT